jgi:glucose/arabinose dehydrogenase
MPDRAVLSRVAAVAALVALVVTGCGADDGSSPDGGSVEGVEVPDGYSVEEVVDGLDGPTQVVVAPDGSLLVAQLAGGEGDQQGQIVRVDVSGGIAPEVILDGLDKPTGVALVDGDLWVMERRRLSRGPLDDPSEREVVVDDLPFNGRSEGTLTPTGDGALLYNTSGDQDGAVAASGSGTLWRVDEAGQSVEVASGLKNAYAHTVDGDGTLWVTEIADGSFDGRPAVDELVAVDLTVGSTPTDFGWPVCVGDRTPVVENGGTEEICDDSPPSHAVFSAGATPTSVAVAPWDPDVLVVALWNEGRVVTIPRTVDGAPHEATDLVTGIEHPQHLLVDGDRLLLVDFDGGRILAVVG